MGIPVPGMIVFILKEASYEGMPQGSMLSVTFVAAAFASVWQITRLFHIPLTRNLSKVLCLVQEAIWAVEQTNWLLWLHAL